MNVANWNYSISSPSKSTCLKRLLNVAVRRFAFPPYQVVKQVFPSSCWCVYFIYAPLGKIKSSHVYTINRLKSLGAHLLVVYSSPSSEEIPKVVLDIADALYWKGLDGYDFSAYSIAMRAICEKSEGADVFLMNDSVYGPFDDVVSKLSDSKWRLTGVTASADIENHIQTYAFHIKGLSISDLENMKPVLAQNHCFNQFGAVVFNQETLFARIASKSMSVGALRYSSNGDPSLIAPDRLELDGASFLKRSLLEGKLVDRYPHEGLVLFLKKRMHEHPNVIID